MKKRVVTIAVLIGMVGLAIGGWTYYSLTHFSIPVTPAQTEAMQIAFKGVLGEALFGNAKPQQAGIREGTGLDALLAPSAAPQGEGLISAYRKEPEKFKRYSQLFDTALNAKRIGRLVQTNRLSYKLPLASSSLSLGDGERLDAWGHPYCVTALKAGVAVVSGGPESKSFGCDKQQVRAHDLASAKREISETSSGEIVVLVGVASVRDTN